MTAPDVAMSAVAISAGMFEPLLYVVGRLIWRNQAIRRDNTRAGRTLSWLPRPHKALPYGVCAGILFKYTVIDSAMKPDLPIPQSQRLLGQLREVLRCKHYSLRTEQTSWMDWYE